MSELKQKLSIVILTPLAMIAASFLLLMVLGLLTPKNHVVTKSIKLKQTPENIWETISDIQNQTSWRSEIEKVERMPDRDGREVWKEVYKNGDELLLEITESNAPVHLVRTITDPDLNFKGVWEIEVKKDINGCSLTITEQSEIPNPLIRGMYVLFIGNQDTVTQYENELLKKFGENGFH